MRDGSEIPGAINATYDVEFVTEDDEGLYVCQVTDGAKAPHETEPVLVEVFTEDQLPAAGLLAMVALTTAVAIGAARTVMRKSR